MARAQSALERFEPAPLVEDGFTVSSPSLLAPRQWVLTAAADYARAPLEYELGAPASLRQRVVSDALAFHVGGAVGVHRRITLFASLPIHALMRGDSLLLRDARPEGAGVGDLRLAARFGLLERAHDALAAEVIARLPTAEWTRPSQRYSGDQAGSYDASLLGERRLGRIALRARLGVRLRKQAELANLSLGSSLLFAAGLHVRVSVRWAALLELDGSTFFSDFFGAQHTPAELLAGAKYTLPSSWLAVAGGPGLSQGYGTPDYRLLAMVGFARRAPPAAVPAPPLSDVDGDGVLASDRCPDQAEDLDGVQDADGCPDPDVVVVEREPCTDPSCMEREPPVAVADCSAEPDSASCRELQAPEDAVQASSEGELVAFGRVEYAVGKGSALASSIPTLLAVRSILETNPQLRRTRIEGHSDDSGNPEYNLYISRRRARAVARWLVERGITPERLEIVACGDRYPREAAADEKGMQANRRVEFHVVDPPGSPHGHDECEPVPLRD